MSPRTSTCARRWSALALLAALSAGCVDEVTLPEVADPEEVKNGDTRTVELRFMRLDAKGFVQVLTLEDIKARFPEQILKETWLLDMDLRPLITNALTTLIATPESEASEMPLPARNMWRLLNMTPDNTVLDGTSLEGLLGVGEAVGLGPATILGDLLSLDANAPVITVGPTTDAVIEHVVQTHPGAQLRRGPVNAEHPDGLYPVAPGSLPVSLWDVVTDFADMPKTFGPAPVDPEDPLAERHPGFIGKPFVFKATTPEFKMTVKVDLNALPYKGVDLTDGTVASVNSTKSQIDRVFDFSSDDWMQIEGLVPALVIDEMTMTIYENADFVASGTAREPEGLGDSEVWDLPEWQFERLIAEVARVKAGDIDAHCSVYAPQGQVDPPFDAVNACIGVGDFVSQDTGESCQPGPDNAACVFDPAAPAPEDWVSIAVDDSVVLDTPPPPPSYFWDVLLEVAQVRLHDGDDGTPIPEGDANIALTLKNVAVGVTVDQLVAQIRENIQKNPAALAAIAELLNENTLGAADFFYYVPAAGNPADVAGDWLWFVTADDIEGDEDGDPVRGYTYASPGFYADAGLKTKVSSQVEIDGDTRHEKVKIAAGDTLYVEDDAGRRFKLVVGDKPAPHRVALDITRVR